MYRVFFVLAGGLLLASCSSTPEWMSLDALKPGPITDSVQFESEPAGATATVSSGQNCKTPCSIALPVDAPVSVTFTLQGYQPDTEQLESVAADGGAKLQPNPVVVELTPAPPPAKPTTKKKPAKKKTSATKPAPAPAAATTAAAPAPATSAAAPATATSPWPSTPPAQQK
jgi:hypothetical protein